MTTVLFAAAAERWDRYGAPIERALAETGVDAQLVTEAAPETVDYIVLDPGSGVTDFRPFTRLKAVLNLWAGVEAIAGNSTLKAPLARMVDDGMTDGMVEYVTAHVLRHHVGLDRYIQGLGGRWDKRTPPLARDRKVGVLGLGALGGAAVQALARLNFDVAGWSRREKSLDGVACHHGAEGLRTVLGRSEIVVLLTPLTPETENLIDAAAIALLPRGAVIVNPARGALIDDAALLAALDSGHLGHATLDAFREEPLPSEHPFWTHPNVTVTPHIASETRPDSASRVIAENIRRGEAGEPFLHLVDRTAGY
jgi:glyoxylate/hydroxypyruvate reductase A